MILYKIVRNEERAEAVVASICHGGWGQVATVSLDATNFQHMHVSIV
jgi:hypothetical protein